MSAVRSSAGNAHLVALSSIVIIISLAFAFSTWARTVLAIIFRLPYAYLADWMSQRKIKSNYFYSASALKRFEREKVQEMQRRTVTRRVTEISRASQGRSSVDDQDLKSSWGWVNRKAVNKGTIGFWNRSPRRDSESG